MDSKALVDPELLWLLQVSPPLTLSDESLPAIRAGFAMAQAEATAGPDLGVSVEAIMIPGPAGAPDVRVLLYRPKGADGPSPAILHIHGGGYVLGSAEMMDAQNRALASELDCLIASVDYRLAPETPHPGGLEDCYAALQWLKTSARHLGVDVERIGVKGESAGGGLAAALALLARDRGGPKLAFQHLIYPMLDDRTCAEADPNPYTGEYLWTRAANSFGWSSLLGAPAGAASAPVYAAAARAVDLTGLPPAFIAVGALDLFLDENLAYARRLSRAGVAIELHVYPGAFHGFHMVERASVTITAERDSRDALRRSLGSGDAQPGPDGPTNPK